MTDFRSFLLTRAGTIEPNPTTFIMRSKAWANARPNGSSIVVWRDEAGIHNAVVTPVDASAKDSAVKLAVSVAAHSDESDIDLPVTAVMRAARIPRRVSIETRETVAGADPAETARALALSLGVGDWVAISSRQPARREKKWWRRWLSAQFGNERSQHHSTREGASVAAVYAGSTDRVSADNLLHAVFAALPGFDLPIETYSPSTWAAGLPVLAGAGVAGLLGFVAGSTGRLDSAAVLCWAAAAVLFVAGVLTGVGRIPTLASKARLGRFTGLFPVARADVRPPRPPKRSFVDKEGVTHDSQPGDYPLARTSFMVGADLIAAFAAPQAGAASGENSTAGREAPAAVQDNVGPLIGVAGSNGVHLSAADMFSGIIALGSAGTGKSVFVHNVFGWTALEKAQPSGRPGFPGAHNSLIAFENKGDGADHYVRFAQYAGEPVYRVELGDPKRAGIDLFPPQIGSVEFRARLAAGALKYTFGEDSIQERSFDTLRRVFAAAFVISEKPEGIATVVDGVPDSGSPFLYAAALMGERGDDVAVALAGQLQGEAMRLDAGEDTDLGFAATQITPLFSGLTPSKRGDLFQAPRNKITNLLAAEQWWSRPARLTWDQVLDDHLTIVVNTGQSIGGQPIDDKLTEEMSGLLMYTLYDAIKRRCSGWQDMHRHVTVFADELKLLAGKNPEIITWLRDQGRSFGVQPVFATQRTEQLDKRVKEAVTGFGTVLAFAQDNPQVAKQLADDFAADGSVWQPADIVNLPPYVAIVRTKVGKTRQPAFTCALSNFETGSGAVVDDYRAAQGY
ncbi:hypothetical protein F8O07_06630 [Pseudoclavibacter sp. CFCC 13796]|uniref:hypothetical protein n=1 Tax=Pseudoclavibacter sp. CFCC 13796 TaxID=2615179 RepID=UPI00130126A5|nr:hypothetical protein [Pseudoclavibacter sp. CFCC 13796]KAB1661574.1 hypothetical protein F8O07_06630 [Pseudoclavibacter sp. CFCC 13796]